jgi:hypothetical protein
MRERRTHDNSAALLEPGNLPAKFPANFGRVARQWGQLRAAERHWPERGPWSAAMETPLLWVILDGQPVRVGPGVEDFAEVGRLPGSGMLDD